MDAAITLRGDLHGGRAGSSEARGRGVRHGSATSSTRFRRRFQRQPLTKSGLGPSPDWSQFPAGELTESSESDPAVPVRSSSRQSAVPAGQSPVPSQRFHGLAARFHVASRRRGSEPLAVPATPVPHRFQTALATRPAASSARPPCREPRLCRLAMSPRRIVHVRRPRPPARARLHVGGQWTWTWTIAWTTSGAVRPAGEEPTSSP